MRDNINLWLGRIGLCLIFYYSFVASIYYSFFAQIHVTLSFLPFPVFIGEILLFVCLVLFLCLSKDAKLFDRHSIVLLGLYFGWVLLKSLINYYYDGPLTCRNAALFYYPIFAVFAYCFYKQARIPHKVFMSLAFLAAACMLFKVMLLYYWWTYVMLYVIAVLNIKTAKWRWLGWAFLAILLLLGKEYLYQGSRSHFVSVFVSIVFLGSYLGRLMTKRREFVRLGIMFIGLLFFILGYFIFSEHSTVTSVTSLKGMVKTYHNFDKIYKEDKGTFVPQKLTVHLYNYKKFKSLFSSEPTVTPQSKVAAPVMSAETSQSDWLKSITSHILRNRIREGRTLDLDENNIVFRLFVWRDMAHELIEKKAWWGFSFGHPQRSKSLEVLHWAEGEWSRDGWITPHNSFFHVIYRAGILGILLIGVLFFMIGGLVRDFFKIGSIEGGLLVAALVYWLVLSNFLVILEFPYNAIVFWTLFGITGAYRDGLKPKAVRQRG